MDPCTGGAATSSQRRLLAAPWLEHGLAVALAVSVLVLGFAHATPTLVIGVAGGLTAVLGGLLGRRFGFDRVTVGVVIAGLLLDVAYWSYTSHAERNYDGPEQMRYILLVARELRIPEARECFVCHQPPLYFVLAAPVARLSFAMFPAAPVLLLQLASLWLHVAFIWLGLFVVARTNACPVARRLAAVLLVFWPLSVMRSVQVHNDALVGPLLVAALERTLAWESTQRPRDLLLAALASALAVATR